MIDINTAIWTDGTVRSADMAFPMLVSAGEDVSWDEARVCIVDMEEGGYVVFVWSKGTGSGPELVLASVVDEVVLMKPMKRELNLEDGTVLTYVPSRHCGCGGRLKSFRPWAGHRVVGMRRPAQTTPASIF